MKEIITSGRYLFVGTVKELRDLMKNREEYEQI